MSELGTCRHEPVIPHRRGSGCCKWKPLAPRPAKQPTALEQSAYRGYRKVHVFLQPEEAAEVEAWLAAYEAEYPAIKDPVKPKYELCDTVFPDGRKCVRPKNHHEWSKAKCSPTIKFMEYSANTQAKEAELRVEANKKICNPVVKEQA